MLKNTLKVLTTVAQTLVHDELVSSRIVNIIFYNPTATTTTFDLTLTNRAGTKISLRKTKSLATLVEDKIEYTILMQKGDKLEALASASGNINVLVNYEEYNGAPVGV